MVPLIKKFTFCKLISDFKFTFVKTTMPKIYGQSLIYQRFEPSIPVWHIISFNVMFLNG